MATWIFRLFIAADLMFLWLLITRGSQYIAMIETAYNENPIIVFMTATAASVTLLGILGLTAFSFYLKQAKKKELEAAEKGDMIPPPLRLFESLQSRNIRIASIIFSTVFTVVWLIEFFYNKSNFTSIFVVAIFFLNTAIEIRNLIKT